MRVDVDFVPIKIETDILAKLQDPYASAVCGWNRSGFHLTGSTTTFGVVTEGEAVLEMGKRKIPLSAGMFFVLNCEAVIGGANGCGLLICSHGYRGLFQVGGPVEQRGRLLYIDGCSDTLLVCPPRLGEPCLNHLHIPPHTRQTEHTHPSERVGVILRGRGECRTPEGTYPLEPGMGWRIPTGCLHSFHTQAESLDVIAWHPDSDFGPTDENHPMINRTIIR
jgi:mannose-6-phosphate isomerase-like protein (cupin superfamily)